MDPDATIRQELATQFGDVLDNKLLDQCVQLCKDFNFSAERLFYKWEEMTFNYSNTLSVVRVFNMDSVAALREKIQRDVSQVKGKNQPSKPNLSGRQSLDLFKMVRGPKAEPIEQKLFPSAGYTSSSGGMRRAAGAGPSKVKFSCAELEKGSSKQRKYRYMYEKISERSEALDDRIEEVAELVQAYYNVEDLGDPAASTEEETTIVGRITFDSDSVSSTAVKLNEASLTLESSRAMGSGKRVHLKLDPNVRLRGAKKGIGGAGFFPGAIVALRGKNGGGGWFNVTEVLPLPPLSSPRTAGIDDAPFTLAVAAGPYTADADLKYESLKQLVAKWKTEKPSAVILLGPFIDCTHACIKNGDVDLTPLELFRQSVLEPLREMLDALPGTIALVVPSVRDLVSDHAVFPQAELGADVINDPRIHCLPNPCQFTLNGISLTASSVDVLFHLRKEEFFRPMSEINPAPLADNETPANDAMAKLCRHVLQQRSFYPIFPPPLDTAHEVNLDVTHSERLKLAGGSDAADSAPAVLILPSKLKQFHKTIDETVVVNPSYVSKGSYVTMRFEGGKVAQIDLSKVSE